MGGRWMGGHFAYNTAVMHVNTRVIHNTYVDRTVVRNTAVNRTSFNGSGGINARPTAADATAVCDRHISATSAQMSHEHQASTNRGNFASVTTDARRRLLPVLPETSAERQRLLPVLLETLGEGQRLLPVLLETLAEGQRLLPVPLETLAGKQVPLHRRGLRAMAAVAVVVVNTKAGVEAETGVPGNRAA